MICFQGNHSNNRNIAGIILRIEVMAAAVVLVVVLLLALIVVLLGIGEGSGLRD